MGFRKWFQEKLLSLRSCQSWEDYFFYLFQSVINNRDTVSVRVLCFQEEVGQNLDSPHLNTSKAGNLPEGSDVMDELENTSGHGPPFWPKLWTVTWTCKTFYFYSTDGPWTWEEVQDLVFQLPSKGLAYPDIMFQTIFWGWIY